MKHKKKKKNTTPLEFDGRNLLGLFRQGKRPMTLAEIMRDLVSISRAVAEAYYASREELGFPMVDSVDKRRAAS